MPSTHLGTGFAYLLSAVQAGTASTVRLFLSIPLSIFLFSAACSDPCTELSDIICRCERSEIEQQACLQRVDTSGPTELDAGEEECCIELLDTCTCDRLADGDLAACGIAHESDAGTTPSCLVPESNDPR